MNKKVDFPQNVQPITGELLEQVQNFDNKELYWLSGYCSGLADARGAGASENAIDHLAQPTTVELTSVALKTQVLYATQSGNSQKLAESLHRQLGQKGLSANISSIADLKPAKLKELDVILLVASTHGEGEPPDDAIDFHETLLGKRSPKLAGVHHAVLSLGDSSYEFFCQTGKDFDQAFEKQGSKALLERVDCDLDFETPAAQWIEQVVEKVSELAGQNAPTQTSEVASSHSATSGKTVYTKNNPFNAVLLENQKITGRGSVKHINHLELSLENSGIEYQPGDSLGVWAKNNEAVVDEILSVTQLAGDDIVNLKGSQKTLKQALVENLEITLLNKKFISEYAEIADSQKLKEIASESYSEYVKNHQVVDVLKTAPKPLQAQQLVNLLNPIKPRMYSIASSLEASPDEVHLTVALQKSQNENGEQFGAASDYLIQRLEEDAELFVFVEENRHFKLPEDNKPIIMIGPGTGIAPFRSFLQERAEKGASGENWLFFGNPNFNTDFLYQVELQQFLKEGVLTYLSLAFSRDQQEKIYVQDRLLEHADEVWSWIKDKNAYLYVCGDMSRMAKDVESALLTIIQQQGDLDEVKAQEFLKALKKDKRYQRDVY